MDRHGPGHKTASPIWARDGVRLPIRPGDPVQRIWSQRQIFRRHLGLRLNANKWTNKDPFPKPPMRYCHATAYDAQSDRVILFGGDLAGGLFSDTWAYDFNTNAWTDMAPGLSPPATLCDAMAYDSESDRVILFGGYWSGRGFFDCTGC